MNSKGYALHFGLDKVDDTFYAEKLERQMDTLEWSVKDAEGLAKITSEQGFEEVHLRRNEEATRDCFLELLTTTIAKLQAGDLLVISFSGHGGQTEDVMFKDNAFDGYDELLCFYDEILLDDHFFYQICQAPEGSYIHMIIDSCHSGGFEKFEGESEPLSLPFEKFLPEVRIKNYKGKYKDLKTKASTIFWGSARASELAGNGLFTQKLIEIWYADKGKSNYDQFYHLLRQRSHTQYKPSTPRGVNNESFRKEKPFQTF